MILDTQNSKYRTGERSEKDKLYFDTTKSNSKANFTVPRNLGERELAIL